MVGRTQEHHVVDIRGPALGPVDDVARLAMVWPSVAAGFGATPVAGDQRFPLRRGETAVGYDTPTKTVCGSSVLSMGSGESLRVLLAVRLSSLTDETTSPDRQRTVTVGHAERQGWVVIGTAEDLDVSASTVAPLDRPRLGPWPREPGCHEWDVVVFWPADRAVRSMADMFALNKGKPVAGPEGAPVRIAEPVLSLQEFQRVRDALSARSTSPTRTRRTTPLLGVVKCGRCGRNASRVSNV